MIELSRVKCSACGESVCWAVLDSRILQVDGEPRQNRPRGMYRYLLVPRHKGRQEVDAVEGAEFGYREHRCPGRSKKLGADKPISPKLF